MLWDAYHRHKNVKKYLMIAFMCHDDFGGSMKYYEARKIFGGRGF
jgi:hypothetical protein